MGKKLFILFAFVSTLVLSLGFSSCSSNDDDSKYEDVTITAGSTQSLSEGKNLDWKSENDYVATISNGKINAKRVGKVKMVSKDGSFYVNVTPKYTYYEEPYLQFGASVQSVKKAMKGYTLLKENDESLTYEGKGYTRLIGYLFKNSKLTFSCFYTSASYVDQLANWTTERYIVLTTDDYVGMLSVDKKYLILLTTEKLNNSWFYSVGYGEGSNSSNAKSIIFDNSILERSSNNIEYLKAYTDYLKVVIK